MEKLTRGIVAWLALACLALAQPEEAPFTISGISSREVSPGVVKVQLTTSTLRAITPLPTVPIPTAPLLLAGTIPLGQLVESNILDSFMPADLDGDRDFEPILVRLTSEGLRIGGVLVEPLGAETGPQHPYQKNGEMRRYLLDPDGLWFSVLYYAPPALGLLLEDRAAEPQVLELPNPHLQMMVFEHSDPVDNPRFLPDPPGFSVTFDGKSPAEQHLLFAWEPAVFESLNLSPRWIRAYWFAVPLSGEPNVTEHTMVVKPGDTDSAIGIFAQINWSTEAGVRQRTAPALGIIWSPTAASPGAP